MSMMVEPTKEEIEAGLVLVGAKPEWGFTVEDWLPDCYLWHADGSDKVICSLLLARHPGNGAFQRLVAGIEADGLRVAVPCPLGQMPAILKHMGFVKGVEQDPDFGDVEVWTRPLA